MENYIIRNLNDITYLSELIPLFAWKQDVGIPAYAGFR